MIRRSLYNMLGGLDDRFFAHMEEIDLCWRIQLNGYRVRVVPQSVVYHLGGGTLPQSSPWKLKLNYRNNLLLLENNLAKTYGLQLLRSADKDIDLQQIAKQACFDDADFFSVSILSCMVCRAASRSSAL